jgi:phosphoglycerate-specific signal transduction histidine kinase
MDNGLLGMKYYPRRGVELICERYYMCGCDDNHERAAIKSILAVLVQNKKLSPSDVQDGMEDSIIFVYARNQLDHLGDILATMIKVKVKVKVKAADINWICEQAADILTPMIKARTVDFNWICEQGVGTMAADLRQATSAKTMQSLALSVKNTLGADETRSVMEGSASIIRGFIGPDKLASIMAGL